MAPVATTAMTFDDEFNSFSSSPDGSSGTWMTSLPYDGEAARTLTGNDEGEYYSDASVGEDPFSLSNGVLSISATPAAPGSNPYGLPYDSGVITTAKSFSQLYGYFEIRAQLPSGQGLWPAFWMLPASLQYTAELDAFEEVDDATTLYATTHGSTDGSWTVDSQAFSTVDASQGFHTFGVDWEPTTTTFYMDGQELGSAPTPQSMDTPMFMLLNLAVGGQGSWPGAPNASTQFPASFNIDYVRAYATANTVSVSGSAAEYIPTTGISGDGGETSGPTVIGTGPDTLTLDMAEDAWEGDAQFTVSIDGSQIGGTQTVTASHADGLSQVFLVETTLVAGSHQVSVDFTNDAYGGSATTDRNLYIDSAALGSQQIAGSTLTYYSDGAQDFYATKLPSGPTVIGTGPDTLTLDMAEDAWEGDAQFAVSVDGTQIGGMQTVTASHADGQSQVFLVETTLAAGPHQVSVDFTNDAYGGSATTDRNLYVDGAALNGQQIDGSTLALYGGGAQNFSLVQPDTLELQVSEDAWQGDAEFMVTVDGAQVGGVYTATASHAAGNVQTVSIATILSSSSSHTVRMTFINDAYGGTPETDRNLYVEGVTLDGVAATPASAALMWDQTATFDVPAPGTGNAAVTLLASEDAYQGDAEMAVWVDGTLAIPSATVTASHAAGQQQTIDLPSGLAPGLHDIAVAFLNDAFGGTAATDRNLYLSGISLDGNTVPGSSATFYQAGTHDFILTVPSS